MRFEIKSRFDQSVLFSIEIGSLKLAVEAAVKLRANLGSADLYGANLGSADLIGADLSGVKNDLFNVLLHATHEVDGLVTALKEGRVNGAVYKGDCSCLVGTLAKVHGCRYDQFPELVPDSSRPAEKWFLGIRIDDTPDKNQIVAITLEWIAEFQKLMANARV